MKVNLRKIRKQRRYKDAFKKQLVREFESGKRFVEVKQSSKKKVSFYFGVGKRWIITRVIFSL